MANKGDPLKYKIRFLRYHWRCVVDAILNRDWEAAVVDYHVHMVRYAKSNG